MSVPKKLSYCFDCGLVYNDPFVTKCKVCGGTVSEIDD